jgi:uncharacterized repeat protein (TIGR03806 family)
MRPKSFFRAIIYTSFTLTFTWHPAAVWSAEDNPLPGIAQRVAWTTSKVVGTPEPPVPYLTEPVFEHLRFENPVDLMPIPGTSHMLVVEVGGKLRTFSTDSDVTQNHLAADLSILPAAAAIGTAFKTYGFAFENNRTCYACYVLKANDPNGTRVSRFRASSIDPLEIDLSTEEVIISWLAGGHNGGSLQFGPKDGYLYISAGDGAPAFPPDTHKTGQDISDLLASVLRIDVDHPTAELKYSIPEDNPFVATEGARGEVWTYGHRNPWRMSFDPVRGDLWIGDVGWEMWEMIYRAQPGANFGWSLLEYTQPVHPDYVRGPTPITPPAAAHSHTEARSITGGHVYRGQRLKELQGNYIYGDYVTGKVWALNVDESTAKPREIAQTALQIVCFGVDQQQELYIVSYDGTLHHLARSPNSSVVTEFPSKLSGTGLFQQIVEHELADGVLPYAINAEPWEDGTTAQRFIALPGTTQLGVHEKSNIQRGDVAGEWSYPDGAVLGKTISLRVAPNRERRLETQILHRNGSRWEAYSYVWNDDQDEATLSLTGFNRQFEVEGLSGDSRLQTWRFASRTECILCHTSRRGSVYGFRASQLNRNFDYGDVSANQLTTFAHIGLLAEPILKGDSAPTPSIEKIPRTIASSDTTQSLELRARSYLHLNCATCHCRGGGGSASIELVDRLTLTQTRLVSRPTQGSFGIHDPWIMAPGDPLRSVLYYRMVKIGRGRMPHFGSQLVDVEGSQLIHDWIAQLDPLETEDRSDELRRLQKIVRESLASIQAADRRRDDQNLPAIERLLSTTSGALALARIIRRDLESEQDAIDDSLAEFVVACATKHNDAIVRDLFEPFIPEQSRTKRLGATIDPDAVLGLQSNFERGRKLFLESELQCKNCHRISGQTQVASSKEVGPDLMGIGSRLSRREILTNILDPSRSIDPKYRTWLAQTDAGQVVVGLMMERTDKTIVIRDATGKTTRLAVDELDILIVQQKSLMPELLLRDSTAQDAADLLKFLEGLKTPPKE